MMALLEAHRQGLMGRAHWWPNVAAGLVVAVVALPLAMAFAIASGAKPEQGIYTAIVAGLVAAMFGGSRLQVTGPTGAFIVILSDVVARHGMAGLQMATIMAGVFLVGLGLAKLGTIIRFIPGPVITGFTAGIAIIIWVGQWRDFFGLPTGSDRGAHFHEKCWHLLQALPEVHGPTTALAMLGLAAVVWGPRLRWCRAVPGPLLGLLVVTVVQGLGQWSGVATIGSAFGGIPSSAPTWQWPQWHLSQVVQLLGPAFTIAMLGAIESLLSAVVADGMARTRHDANQELIGQGLANVVAPLFGGFAATGAIARTATNVRHGATSPLAAMVHALALLLMVLVAAPLASHIPLAALAAILFVVAWNMAGVGEVSSMLRRAPTADRLLLLVTLCMTVFADLVVAVNIGVILATLHFMRRMASSVEVRPNSDDELRQELGSPDAVLPEGVMVFSVDGPLFFGAVESLDHVLASTHTDPRVLIIRLRWVPFIDMTGLQKLEQAIRDLQARGVSVWLTGANDRVTLKLDRAGLLDLVGRQQVYPDIRAALAASRGLQP